MNQKQQYKDIKNLKKASFGEADKGIESGDFWFYYMTFSTIWFLTMYFYYFD